MSIENQLQLLASVFEKTRKLQIFVLLLMFFYKILLKGGKFIFPLISLSPSYLHPRSLPTSFPRSLPTSNGTGLAHAATGKRSPEKQEWLVSREPAGWRMRPNISLPHRKWQKKESSILHLHMKTSTPSSQASDSFRDGVEAREQNSEGTNFQPCPHETTGSILLDLGGRGFPHTHT